MNVLVTGGAGYIGSHCARELARRGHRVVIYDNLSTGHEFLAQGFPLVKAGVGDAAALNKALQGMDAIMHFAAASLVGESVKNPRKYFDNNNRDGLILLNTAMDRGIRNFIFSSTAATYGVPQRSPITEDMPKTPVNPYGSSKLFFEYALQAYDVAYGMRSVALRYFNAAGCDEKGDIGEIHDPETHLIPNALAAVAGTKKELEIFGDDYPTPDGTCVRDYIDVRDLATAHALALEYLERGGATTQLNLATGRGNSVKEVVAAVERITGKPLPRRIGPRRAGDPPVLVADPSKAEKLLQWKAKYSLDDMIASAWNFMQQQARRETVAGR